MNSSNKTKVKIFGVPVDLGAKALGVSMGPSAIRYAGLIDALKLNDIEYVDYGDMPVNRSACTNGQIEGIARLSGELSELVAQAVDEGYIPIILGGDHSAAIGSIAGASLRTERLGLLWLDCHPDANTPETSPSGNVHGMTVAISLGYGYPQLVNCAGFAPKVLPEDVCIIGAKDIDKGERELLDSMGIKMFTIFDIQKNGIVQVCEYALETVLSQVDRIHVSFDIDVLDPVIAPGTGILSRGGLSYREISYIMEAIKTKNRMGSIDIIELNPLLDIKNQTAELIVELLLTAIGGSYGDYERYYLSENYQNNER